MFGMGKELSPQRARRARRKFPMYQKGFNFTAVQEKLCVLGVLGGKRDLQLFVSSRQKNFGDNESEEL